MTVEPEAGYTWTDGKHARIMHSGLGIQVASISSSNEVSGYPATAVDVGNTVDRWRPFSNLIASPTDLGDTTEWSAPTNATIGSDGQTYDEGSAASATNSVQQAYTFTAGTYVAGIVVSVQDMDAIRIAVNDGTSTFTGNFDLRDRSLVSISVFRAQI